MAYEARALANHILDLADESGIALTHMAVHKVAYYGHGWRLVQKREPLITDMFEAWEYGPVLPTVYAAFKIAGKSPVALRAYRFDPMTQQKSLASGPFSAEDTLFIRNIVRAYGRLNAITLSDMTHRPGGAWDQVWNAPNGRITLGMKIKNETIAHEFSNIRGFPRIKS